MAKESKVAVVGGGIVGLVAALHLCEEPGVVVTLYDPAPGLGATHAAAGMLAPTAELRPAEAAGYRLQLRAIPAWRETLKLLALPESTLHESGTLYVGWDASDRRLLEQFETVAKQHDAQVSRVDRVHDEELFAGIHQNIVSGLFLPGDSWLDPDLVVETLVSTLKGKGVDIRYELVNSCSAEGVLTSDKSASQYDAVLLATGSAQLTDKFPAVVSAVRPVRGITVHVDSHHHAPGPMVRAFVRGRDFYAVNRGEGKFVIGASSEERSELGIEVGELERLLRDAAEVLPFLETAVIGELRRGLRPTSESNDPFLERVRDTKVIYSSGHSRHGVTLAPVTASETVELVKDILHEN